MKIGNRSFENVSQFKLLGMTVTNQYLIQEDSVQILLSSRLLLKNVKIRIYKKHILVSLTNFTGIPNSVRMLYNTSLLTES
jgi:hypothetical protein